MEMTQDQISKIVAETLKALNVPAGAASSSFSPSRWLCDTAEEAIETAKKAYRQLSDMTLEKRGELIAAMRKAALDNAEYLAKLANEETGYGHVEHKIAKNKLAANKTPGIEDLKTAAVSGDEGFLG